MAKGIAMFIAAVVIAAVVIAAGCGGSATPSSPTPTLPIPTSSTPTSPAAVSPAGNWSGAISDPVLGEGTARLSLTEAAPDLFFGSWSATFTSGGSLSGMAVAALTSRGYGITLNVDPPPACAGGSGTGGSNLLAYTLIQVVVTSTRLSAVAGRTACAGLGFGTIDLSKQ
jgi:hypothetical protein